MISDHGRHRNRDCARGRPAARRGTARRNGHRPRRFPSRGRQRERTLDRRWRHGRDVPPVSQVHAGVGAVAFIRRRLTTSAGARVGLGSRSSVTCRATARRMSI